MSRRLVIIAMRRVADGAGVTGRVNLDKNRFLDWIRELEEEEGLEERVVAIEERMALFEKEWGLRVDQ